MSSQQSGGQWSQHQGTGERYQWLDMEQRSVFENGRRATREQTGALVRDESSTRSNPLQGSRSPVTGLRAPRGSSVIASEERRDPRASIPATVVPSSSFSDYQVVPGYQAAIQQTYPTSLPQYGATPSTQPDSYLPTMTTSSQFYPQRRDSLAQPWGDATGANIDRQHTAPTRISTTTATAARQGGAPQPTQESTRSTAAYQYDTPEASQPPPRLQTNANYTYIASTGQRFISSSYPTGSSNLMGISTQRSNATGPVPGSAGPANEATGTPRQRSYSSTTQPSMSSVTRPIGGVSALTTDLASTSIQPQYVPQVPAPNSLFGPLAQRLQGQDAQGVRYDFVSGSPDDITDPDLRRRLGVRAHLRLLGTEGDYEEFDSTFRVRKHPRNFFVPGKVFMVLWAEPGNGASDADTVTSVTRDARFGQPIYSKVRRFVVIKAAENHCTAIPILSHNHKGVSKRGLRKSDFAVIYTGRIAPDLRPDEYPKRGEAPIRQFPIRVDPDERGSKLNAYSRVNFAKVYTVEHNVKVKSWGMTNRDSMGHLTYQFRDVWVATLGPYQLTPWVPAAAPAVGEPSSSSQETTSGAPQPANTVHGYTREQVREHALAGTRTPSAAVRSQSRTERGARSHDNRSVRSTHVSSGPRSQRSVRYGEDDDEEEQEENEDD